MSAHTPTPWTVEKMFLGDSEDRRSGLVINGPPDDPLPKRICDMRVDQQTGLLELRANAEFIVRACNSHAMLTHACRLALEIMSCRCNNGQVPQELCDCCTCSAAQIIQSALAKAGGAS